MKICSEEENSESEDENESEPMPKILWHGKHLDGVLTILTSNAIPMCEGAAGVTFILIPDDYTLLEFTGYAEVFETPGSVLDLLARITTMYLAGVQKLKDEDIADGTAYLQ